MLIVLAGGERLWVFKSHLAEIPSKQSGHSELAHKKGEHFDEDWDYAGVKRVPKHGEDYVSYCGVHMYAASGNEVDKSIDKGYREILVPRQKFIVGDKKWRRYRNKRRKSPKLRNLSILK